MAYEEFGHVPKSDDGVILNCDSFWTDFWSSEAHDVCDTIPPKHSKVDLKNVVVF